MKVYSVFRSLDGEVNAFYQGRVTTFLRFSGCNLCCSYCDTQYAREFSSGKEMFAEKIINEIEKFNTNKITITGGEPLLQDYDELIQLCRILNLEKHYSISLETNGSIIIPDELYKYVGSFIVDYKLPSSGEQDSMIVLEEVLYLRKTDFIKFVISDRYDFDVAEHLTNMIRKKNDLVNIAFSPVTNNLKPSDLVNWIEQSSRLDVIVNLQLHKIIWPDINKNNER